MASKISKDSARAFWDREKFKRSNTQVVVFNKEVLSGDSRFFLFGHVIAELTGHDHCTLRVRDCCYKTVTTKRRLNAILARIGASITQENFEWFLHLRNGDKVEWNSGLAFTEIQV